MTFGNLRLVLAVALLLLAAHHPASAKTFRWAAQGDAATLDPHGTSAGLTLGFQGNIYDGLVRRVADRGRRSVLSQSRLIGRLTLARRRTY